MKADIKKNLISKFILTEFVKGSISTSEDVDNMLTLIMSRLNMDKQQAADFFRETIGI